jgi:hypothetical protein
LPAQARNPAPFIAIVTGVSGGPLPAIRTARLSIAAGLRPA